jgi:Conserved TM helix
MNTVNVFQDWTEAVLASLANAMSLSFAALPKILGFIVIIIVGWLIAAAIAGAIGAILRRVRFNELADRSGFAAFVKNAGVDTDPAGLIALVTKWFVRLIALVVAFDALGLPAVSDVLRSLLLWLPNLAVALVVLVIGGLIANAFAGLVRGATTQAGFDNPDMLATIARVAVWFFAILVAVTQIGIAATLVDTLFTAVVGAAALALGLSFGLGGRETAAQIVHDWYTHAPSGSDKWRRDDEAGSRKPSPGVPH